MGEANIVPTLKWLSTGVWRRTHGQGVGGTRRWQEGRVFQAEAIALLLGQSKRSGALGQAALLMAGNIHSWLETATKGHFQEDRIDLGPLFVSRPPNSHPLKVPTPFWCPLPAVGRSVPPSWQAAAGSLTPLRPRRSLARRCYSPGTSCPAEILVRDLSGLRLESILLSPRWEFGVSQLDSFQFSSLTGMGG